ncbi:MAG TPA: response regulator [Nitrospiraceae bacterium]|jgi:DNA-binding response OmpR family regulator|nr:response regulator [Nitrospiraceae bacterium]
MQKVLVADDSIAVRKVAERLLTEAGFGVTLAANGEEALAYLAKETPDLVVSDVIMPDKSGYEVCAFVRAQRALANTPVLLISGIVNDEVTRQAESCHADGVLKKPFQGTSLKDRVLELLAKRHGPAAPAAKNIERMTESVEPIQSARVSNEQLEIYRQAVARLKPLEEELRVERDRATRSTQRVSQLEGQLGSVKELESMLAGERERTAQLKQQLAEVDSATARVQDLEAALEKEREGSAQQAMRMAELQKNASRVQELEATLHAERQAATQLVEQMTVMERAVTRSQELAQQLVQEQERTSDLTRRVAEGEQIAARASRLEQALAAEQDKSKGLAARLSEAERAAPNAQEFETLLQTERERNSLLARRVAETEQASEQATKRFEELATKLGEIAGLASQLGSGKRRP